jgi:signal transduction histidine kinase
MVGGIVSDRLQHLVRNALSHEKDNYQFLLQDYGRELTLAPLKTERILAMFLDRCETAIHPDRAVVFLRNPTLNAYAVSQQIGKPLPPDSHLQFTTDDELPRRLAASRTAHADRTEAIHLALNSTNSALDGFSEDESSRLSVLDAVLFVPLNGTEQLIGWIALSSKSSGAAYRQNDLGFLTTLANQTAIALENAQLLEATERRALQLASLNQVSRSINQTLDLDTVLQLIMEKSLELLDAEAGSILLADADGSYLTFEVVLGPVGNQLRGAHQTIGSGIGGTVAQERKALIVNDAQMDPRWDVSFDRTTDFVTRNLICVPMISHDRLIGVIEVLNKRVPANFSEEDTELLNSFAAQAAIAIENARLFTMTDQALTERVQQLHTMQVIDQQLNATLDFAHVSDLTLQHAMDALSADTGVLGIFNEEGNEFHLAAQQGTPADYDRTRDEWLSEHGVIDQVARTGQPVIINASPTAPDFDPINPQAHSQITVPIHYQDKVQAVVSLESVRPEAFNQSDLEFVTRLANHAAIAIENARLYEQAQAANQAKTEFMSVASHELKIPMTSIKGYAKLLTLGAAGELNERQRDFLEIISSNVDRMDRLVADLLDVSRIEAGRLRLEKGRVDVQKVIDTVVQAVRTQIEAKELSLQLDLPPDMPPAWGDQDRLVQVVTNLVSNAYKYTPTGGKITISVIRGQAGSPAHGFLTISIRDTGVGISPEDQQKLFTKFFRADDPRVRDVPGTGLGLSITKSLVEIHGGEIWFESEADQGTTFSFTLPIAPPDSP